MAYTPPAGSAVPLNFTGAYTPPSGADTDLIFTLGLPPGREFVIAQGTVAAMEFDILTRMDVTPAGMAFEIYSAFILPIGNEFIIMQGAGAELEFDIDSQFLSGVADEFVIVSDMVNTVGLEFVILSPFVVGREFDIVYSLTTGAGLEFDIDYRLSSSAAREFDIVYDILNINRVGVEFIITSPLLEQAAVIVDAPITVTVDGQTFPLQNADVSMDEGQFAWTCNVTLDDPQYFDLFRAEQPFTVHLPEEDYEFIVDSKQLARAEPSSGSHEVTASVGGISPSALLAEPRAQRITKTWDTAMLATDIVNEVLQGYPITWQILDWGIPAFRFGVDNKAPIEIVQLIATAAGAFVETDPDGSLVVRYAFPVSIPQYPVTDPDQVYSDSDNVMVMSESLVRQTLINKLRILDIAADARQDTCEFVRDELDFTKGVLRVWPSPWREDLIVDHTSLPIVSAIPTGVGYEDLDETVEVLRGEGSVSKPIYQINELEWLYVNLTGVAFESDTNKFHSTDPTYTESLLHIKYKTRFLTFAITGFAGGTVQFLVKDVEHA